MGGESGGLEGEQDTAWGGHRSVSTREPWPLLLTASRTRPPSGLQEDVKNEIAIMNQLSHVNLIQLYDAFEGKNSFTLVME